MKTRAERLQDASIWASQADDLFDDRKKIDKFESEACQIRDRHIKAMMAELGLALKKHGLEDWDSYLDDDFNVVNWVEGEWLDYIEEYLESQIRQSLEETTE